MKEVGKNSFYTIVGIIQSFAFVDLMLISLDNITVVSINDSINFNFSMQNWILIMHSIIGFLIIIRLFTTLLFAVEDYSDFVFGLYELFLIFLIGALEIYLFNALRLNENNEFQAELFYFRLMVISVFTFVAYLIAFIQVIRHGVDKLENYKIEKNLQLFNNVGGALFLIVLSVIVVFNDITIQSLSYISMATAGIIFANTLFSYKYSMIIKSGAEGNIKQSTKEDINGIKDLLFEEIDYIYEIIFPSTTLDERKKIITRLLGLADKNNFLHFKKFYCLKEGNKLLGITGLIVTEKVNLISKSIFFLKVLVAVKLTLSFSQVVKFIKSLINNKELFTSDTKHSGYITYIIVNSENHRKGIGSELLKFSIDYFKKRNYNEISLVVRSKNEKAISFFSKHGFIVIKRKQDRFTEQGEKVIMIKEI